MINPVHCLIGLVTIILLATSYNQILQAKNVYNICNAARQELSADSEQACGQAQDRTHTRFLCNNNNTLPNTKCWVEYKGVEQ